MAQPKKTVKILETCMVTPPPAASPDPASPPNSLPLTFFDIRWLRLPPVQRLYFYEFSTQEYETTSVFHSDILPRLKHSLSLTLQHFLPLAGNLTWPETSPKPVVNYVQGDAVSLTVAESNDDYHHLSATEELTEAIAYHPLVPNLAVSHDRAACLALQLTLFQNRGFSIGIATHHAIADGKTSTFFMKSWAHVCRSRESSSHSQFPPELRPVYDRILIKDPAGLEAIYTKHWLESDGSEPNNRSLMSWKLSHVPSASIRGTFRLTRANIEKLRQSVLSDSLRTSTFILACAYTWVCSVKAEGLNDVVGEMILAFNVDCRSRLETPIPETYFGNCIGTKIVVKEAKDLVGRGGLAVAVSAIGEAIKSLENKNGALNGAEDWVSQLSSLKGKESRVYSAAGSTRFKVYSTDFGWGRPRKADLVSIDRTGAFSFSDSRDGDGVEIGLVLKKDPMETFVSLFTQGLQY